MSLIYEVAHWVNGSKFTGSPVGAVDIYNPATGKVQGQLLLGSTDDLEVAVAAAAAEPPPAGGFAAGLPEIPLAEMNELEIQQLRRDIGQLRTEQDFLRSELVALRLDMNEIQGALDRAEAQIPPPQAPASQQYVRPVSPQHSEAMLLAGRGVTAAQIADHCGISVAEAELVCALARAEDGA